MICPRCQSGEISSETNQCVLCGYSPGAGVTVESPERAGLDTAVRRELGHLFHFEAPLRAGPASVVYRAWDAAREERVVVKLVPRGEWERVGAADLFNRGLETISRLDHPHLVPVERFDTSAQFLWYSRRYVEGRSLAELLCASGAMALQPCLRLVDQVASALYHAHRRNLIHANLKPENVLLDAQGWCLVTDFQVARLLEQLGAPGPEAGGTRRPEYMAPEDFFTRQLGPHADQYALAVLVHECLSGAPPFSGETTALVERPQCTEPPPRLSAARRNVPEHVSAALERALSKTPAGRFPDVLEFVSVLQMEQPVPPLPASSAVPRSRAAPLVLFETERREPDTRITTRRASRWWRSVSVAALGVALLAGGRWLLQWPSEAERGALTLTVQPRSEVVPAESAAAAAPPGGALAQAELEPPAASRLPGAALSGAVKRSLEAYRVRAGLFATHQMTCADLSRGLAEVDAQWVRYNVRRSSEAGVSDSGGGPSEEGLIRAVGQVEREFEATGCRRP